MQQIIVAGTTLYRIRVLKDFGNVKADNWGGGGNPLNNSRNHDERDRRLNQRQAT